MPTQFAFFQQAMLALLGSKDVSKGLVRLFEVLHARFGLAGLTFDRLLTASNALKVQYVVSHKGFFISDLELPLSAGETAYLRSNEEARALVVGASLRDNPISERHWKLLEPYVSQEDRGYMVGIMQVEDRVIGHLVCLGQGVGCFNEEHAQYLHMLLPACSLTIYNMLAMGEVHRQNAFMRNEQGRLEREIGVLTDDDMVGAQGGLQQVVMAVRQLAHRDTAVLILGETGTGKELVADAIQKHSTRRGKPFIKVNCGALSETLLDSELFGHEKGAFTGAVSSHQGRFEQADGGTLFLDEVGELSLQAQVRLLRVLQDGTFERIGDRRSRTVNVRIIAATNRDLWAMCQQGLFREDLFHRLNVFPIAMPPLRQRREDIPLLVRHLTARVARRLGIPSPIVVMERLDRLMLYAWPGNVRELENLVERAIILANGGPIKLERLLPDDVDVSQIDEATIPRQQLEVFLEAKFAEWQARLVDAGLLPPSVQTPSQPLLQTSLQKSGQASPSVWPVTQGDTEATIRRVLEQCNGKVYGPGGAAERLGVNHNTLRSRMRRMGIRAFAT